MSGIYIHIPFCKQACHYCDFHFSTSFKTKDEMLKAMVQELGIRKEFLKSEPIQSIYFGGGTPSVVDNAFIGVLLTMVKEHFEVLPNAEITLEANPDDLNKGKLDFYRSIGINRLSIGIQSFDTSVLKYLNRAHDAERAKSSVLLSQDLGFDNISVDLMYGIPGTDLYYWEQQLEIFKSLQVVHLSSYCMTIEPRTVFGNFLRNKKITPIPDEIAVDQFKLLMNFCDESGFEAYEISNFCMKGKYAVHNTGYWKNKNYLGIGPGAHSYNGNVREFNVSNNNIYITNVTNGLVFSEKEELSKENLMDEYIMTSLRTKWGCNIQVLKNNFQYDLLEKPFFANLVENGLIIKTKDVITLSRDGLLIADNIILEIIYNGL